MLEGKQEQHHVDGKKKKKKKKNLALNQTDVNRSSVEWEMHSEEPICVCIFSKFTCEFCMASCLLTQRTRRGTAVD